MVELMGQAAAEATGLGKDFFASWFAEGEDQLLVSEGGEKGHVVLVINGYNRKSGPQEFQGAVRVLGFSSLRPRGNKNHCSRL